MKIAPQAYRSFQDRSVLEEISAKTDEIYERTSMVNLPFPSLLAGDAGVQLFNFMYQKEKNVPASGTFADRLQTLAESSFSCVSPTFCSGTAGVDWLLTFLWKEKILSTEDRNLLCYRNAALRAQSLEMLENGNYDFLHGAIGIAYYLLYSDGCGHDVYFSQFFFLLRSLIDTSEKKDSIPFYDCISGKIDPQNTNLGLAHGIPAILGFCLQCYRQKICIGKASSLAWHIIQYLLEHINEDTSGSYFPYSIHPACPVTANSRLAWCYGDPGVGYILYRAGLAFRDPALTAFSINLLMDTTKRTDLADACISDAGFCHGTAGLSHIYNKMWRHTKNPVFKRAAEYWIRKTLDFAIYPDGIAGYKRFDQANNSYHNEFGMLEGVAGIGLVLLGHLTRDHSWDYCLMLND